MILEDGEAIGRQSDDFLPFAGGAGDPHVADDLGRILGLNLG